MDIQKAFDSVNHKFLTLTLKRYGFGRTFIKRIGILLITQESCIINGGFTTKYFKLDKDTRQGAPISAYLFVFVLEIVFNLIKQNKDIHGLSFFDHTFLYTAYADDITFFLKDKESVKKVMNVFDTFSIYSGLKPNWSKCEIAGISVLKGVSMELCGMECIDLTNNSVKILGIHFSYNKKIENEENFIKLIKKIENVFKIWRIRNLTVQGQITIFKTLKISKVIHLALVTNIPQVIIDQLNKIQEDFIWNRKHPKIRHSTLCNTHENGGLKSAHIPNKLTSLQCSWIKRLYDTTTHCLTITPSLLIRKKLGKNFIFHSSLSINPNKIKEFPTYYHHILIKWENHFSSSSSLPSSVAFQYLCHNKYFKIADKTIFSSSLSAKGINFVDQLFQNNQQIKKWDELKTEFDLIENKKFLMVQIIHVLPISWKEILQNYNESINNLIIQGYHLIKNIKYYH